MKSWQEVPVTREALRAGSPGLISNQARYLLIVCHALVLLGSLPCDCHEHTGAFDHVASADLFTNVWNCGLTYLYRLVPSQSLVSLSPMLSFSMQRPSHPWVV